MTTNESDDNVIDIHVNVNATDRAIEAVRLDADIVPNSDDIAIQILITMRDTFRD